MKNQSSNHLIDAYERMLERANHLIHDAEEQLPAVQQALKQAQNSAIELGELSKEEASKIAGYIKRDAQDAAHYLQHSGKELKDWLRIDAQLVEAKVLDLFSTLADQTRIELDKLAEQARHSNDYFTGDITSPGSLECLNCGQTMQFHKTSHIPPCPKCHKTAFHRAKS
ncbi:MAG: zinc ribbon-containing protein [Gammaproteobacteria bacterium]|nr:zinc ribbon-containing protein [Gammaproteobacteria bacterium]